MQLFESIKFNANFHTYTLDGKRLRNVTSLIKTVKHPFDREGLSAKKAAEQGVPVEFILSEWEEKGRISRERGTKVHHYIQERLTGIIDDDPILALNETLPEMDAFDRFLLRAKRLLQPEQVEWIVGDSDLKIAGTIDAVLMNRNSEQMYLFDWKTGKLNFRNDYGKKMLEPFEDLDDCELNHYSLQLSVYKLILKRNTDLDLGDSYLVHLTEDYQIVKALDFIDRVEAWLEPSD